MQLHGAYGAQWIAVCGSTPCRPAVGPVQLHEAGARCLCRLGREHPQVVAPNYREGRPVVPGSIVCRPVLAIRAAGPGHTGRTIATASPVKGMQMLLTRTTGSAAHR